MIVWSIVWLVGEQICSNPQTQSRPNGSQKLFLLHYQCNRQPCFFILLIYNVANVPRHTMRWGIINCSAIQMDLEYSSFVHSYQLSDGSYVSRMFAALASGTVDQSVLKPKNPLLDLKPRTPPPPEPEEETKWVNKIMFRFLKETIQK